MQLKKSKMNYEKKMQPSKSELLISFENEMWLYIDNSLPLTRMDYWERQLANNIELREYFLEAKTTLSLYDEVKAPDLSEERFANIVNVAINTKKIYSNNVANNIVDFLNTLFYEDFKKVGFAAGLVIAIIFILFQFKQPPAPVVTERYSLDWEAEAIESRISKVEQSLYIMKNRNSVDYAIYKYTKDHWNAARTVIKDQINSIKQDIENKSL